MRKAVLELTGSFQQGGSERQAVQLSRLIKNEGSYDVIVGCLDRSGVLIDEINWLSPFEIPEFSLTSFYDANFVRQVRRCAAFIKENGISIVHTHDFYTNIFGMAAASVARVPARIASKRETFSKTMPQMLIERQAYRFADRIVVNAEAVRDFLLLTGVPMRKIVVIHNGLDLGRFAVLKYSRNETLSELGLPTLDGSKFVTIVANIRSEVKNHRMFLRAAKMVSHRYENALFLIAGEGELKDSLQGFANDLGIGDRVYFIGACERVPALLAISDVCVLSSRSEGFSNVILEYMAAGKPVVATNVGGAAEAVIDGETGYLVHSDDHAALASKLLVLLRDPELAERFGSRGCQIVMDRFTLDSQLTATLELYESLLCTSKKVQRA